MRVSKKAVRYDLGDEARAHLHGKLERWDYHVVTATIKAQLNLSGGEIFAFLPPEPLIR